jgi:hypothetical protein
VCRHEMERIAVWVNALTATVWRCFFFSFSGSPLSLVRGPL